MLISKEVEIRITRGSIRCYKEYNCKINDIKYKKLRRITDKDLK